MSVASVFHSPAAGSKAIVSTLPTGTIRAKPKCGGQLGPTFVTVRRGISTEKGTVNREIAAQNRLLKEIKARTKVHYEGAYSCSEYCKDVQYLQHRKCTCHYITESALEQIVLEELRELLRFVSQNGKRFVRLVMDNSRQEYRARRRRRKSEPFPSTAAALRRSTR